MSKDWNDTLYRNALTYLDRQTFLRPGWLYSDGTMRRLGLERIVNYRWAVYRQFWWQSFSWLGIFLRWLYRWEFDYWAHESHTIKGQEPGFDSEFSRSALGGNAIAGKAFVAGFVGGRDVSGRNNANITKLTVQSGLARGGNAYGTNASGKDWFLTSSAAGFSNNVFSGNATGGRADLRTEFHDRVASRSRIITVKGEYGSAGGYAQSGTAIGGNFTNHMNAGYAVGGSAFVGWAESGLLYVNGSKEDWGTGGTSWGASNAQGNPLSRGGYGTSSAARSIDGVVGWVNKNNTISETRPAVVTHPLHTSLRS